MGLYDTITVDGRRYQTKAFGGWHNTFTVGEPVHVCYLSQSEEEYDLGRTHRYQDLPAAYTVAAVSEDTGEDVIVEVIDGVLHGIAVEARPAHFDRAGRSTGQELHTPRIEQNLEWQQQRAAAAKAVKAVLNRRNAATRAPRDNE